MDGVNPVFKVVDGDPADFSSFCMSLPRCDDPTKGSAQSTGDLPKDRHGRP